MKKNLLSIFALGLGLSSFAQIVYTDINDITLTPVVGRESLDIDLDSDNNIDFTVFALDTTINQGGQNLNLQGIGLELLGNNMIEGTQESTPAGDSYLAVTKIESGTGINSTSNFMSSNPANIFPGAGLGLYAFTPFGPFNGGNFSNTTDKYIAIKFEIGTSQPTTHYGWIRVSVADQCANVIIKDFAYESTANTEIRAGDEGNGFTSISEQELANASVFYGNNELNVNGITGNYNVSVVDLLGKSISNTRVANKTSINLNNVNNGIYLVQITKGNAVVTKKVYIK
jgi:hypothetical protein